MMTTKELCEYFNVHENTIYNWKKTGMPCYGTDGVLRYDLEEVKEWLKKGEKIKVN